MNLLVAASRIARSAGTCVVLAALVVGMGGCAHTGAEEEARAGNHDALYRHWIRWTEEEVDEVQVFRPKDGRVPPPARFRMEYLFARDGRCMQMYLDPADRHRLVDCAWTLKPGRPARIEITGGAAFSVESLEPGLLRLRPTP